MTSSYRGRIAPTPTGYLHLGHARTFWIAMERAREAGGRLIYRDEDIDPDRCKPEFAEAAIEDLQWFGCNWDEGPDVNGPHAPYRQSERMPVFLDAWKHLKEAGFIYPCDQSRKDVRRATQAPHDDEESGDRKSTRLNTSHERRTRIPSSAGTKQIEDNTQTAHRAHKTYSSATS